MLTQRCAVMLNLVLGAWLIVATGTTFGQETGPRLDPYGDPLPAGAVARLGSVRWRHPAGAGLQVTGDGQRLVSSGYHDRRVWDPAIGGEAWACGCVHYLQAQGKQSAEGKAFPALRPPSTHQSTSNEMHFHKRLRCKQLHLIIGIRSATWVTIKCK
jgi:hypothetical protein